MAASRIARLALFSGPHCSLCEVAKAELAKVKQQREFDLEVINIQEKGQEKWKKKYLYWIPALHLDGMEVAKGRWDASTVLEALKEREAKLQIPGVALGEEQDELLSSAGQDLRLCFNCGSPNHAVASCPEPIDRQLVSLSRQLFNFLHPDSGGHEFTRFYVAEGWKQQRLGWLRSYKPGVIRGPLLRDALGLQEGDPGNAVEWLRNMAFWGYPPGWVGRRDPTELACYRILKDEPADGRFTTAEWSSFSIFDGIGDDEEIDLTLFNSGGPSFRTASSLTTSVSGEWTRWATYPDTHFSSTALSVHNGTPLDKVASSSSPVSVTFTPERRALWERILSGGLDTSNTSSVPPWRMPGAFGTSSCLVMEGVEDVNPPPPSSTPPPLPLTPNPPLHTFTPQEFSVLNRESALSFKSEGVIDIADDRSVVDMDVSDDSE